MAAANPTWGYRRITGELARLGHTIAPSTVWTILRTAGIAPSPARVAVTWSALLRSQAAAACDFITVDTFEVCKMLVRDGAGQFTDAFDEIFRTEGINIAKTPPRTPVANCFIERWFGTLPRELLDRTIVWNEAPLLRLVTDYIEPYNEHRPHRSLAQQPPNPSMVTQFRPGVAVTARNRCDGLINEYQQAA